MAGTVRMTGKRRLWARIQRGVLHGWVILASALPFLGPLYVLWARPLNLGGTVVATVAIAWFQTVVWSSYYYALWDIDRRVEFVDVDTERRGRLGKQVLIYAFVVFLAIWTIGFVVPSLW